MTKIEILGKIIESLNNFFAKVAKTRRSNFVLWSIGRGTVYRKIRKEIRDALIMQALALIDDRKLWYDIKDRIGKAQFIWTAKDEQQIREEVETKFVVLTDYVKREELFGFYIYLYNRGGQSYFTKKLNKADIGGVFDLEDPVIIEMLSKGVDLLIDTVDTTTKQWIGDQIIAGKMKKLTDVEIANRIKENITETYAYRSQRIVRTEMAEIVNRAELETAIRNGSQKKTWRAAGVNVCPTCLGNDGVTVGINGSFPSGDMAPTAHPNCGCLLEYTYKEFLNNPWLGGTTR